MPSEPPGTRPGRDIVLVHGGWHGGWVWERLVPHLRAAGHRVHTPTLAGLGDRAAELNPQVGWQTHVDEIEQCVQAHCLGAATLVGHSYGGSIITGVADRIPTRIARLIYLDAVIPVDGVAGLAGFPPERQAAMLAGAQAQGGLGVPPPDPSIWGFDSGTPEHRYLQQRLTPHPLKAMTDAPRISGRWLSVPRKHYLLAAGPPASRFARLHAERAGDPAWTTGLVAGGHEMMWTHPQELSAALLALASGPD
ncbi:MAG: hypothetical protein AD742_16065 [Methylibium sp. NZG]|nr:MAG: hypothetical protein AD742_16065 [Methylibium sp. NZG]